MDLSVVIPTMNKVDLLARTVAALREQDPGPGVAWEIVVVNDGSSDGTAAWLASQEFGDQPALQVVAEGINVGRAKARNLGAQAARGHWILFMDDDIVAPPGLLRAHLEQLRTGPEVGTIGFAVTEPALRDAPHFYYMDSRGAARLRSGPAPGRFFVTQNAAVPRLAFLAAGGFDEEFSAYGFEDMEVAFRLEDRQGIRFRAVPSPVPFHVHHHTLEQYFAKKIECGRHSLPHLARLHPHRIKEMRLHHVIDGDGPAPRSPATSLFRRLADSRLGRRFPGMMSGWPTGDRHRPLLPPLYFFLMNLAVLCLFRQGVTEPEASSE